MPLFILPFLLFLLTLSGCLIPFSTLRPLFLLSHTHSLSLSERENQKRRREKWLRWLPSPEDSLRDLRKTRSSAVALVATWPPSKPLSWVSRPLVLRSVVPSVALASTSVASPPRFDSVLHISFRLVLLRSNWLICCSIVIFFGVNLCWLSWSLWWRRAVGL